MQNLESLSWPDLVRDLRQALAASNELRVFFQPQVEVPGQSIVGLEALVRWQHATRGLIPPDQFIPAAETSGLIVELGEWVLRQACAASQRWPDLFIAINVSPVQFRSKGFVERVIDIIRQSSADPRKIELEITENVRLDRGARKAVRTLRNAGIRIALDDFGVGYSDEVYLGYFEVDKIKIDRSFVQILDGAPASASMITGIISLGHSMGLSVTVEGIETEAQRTLLSSIGCDGMQGYLFSRPLPLEEIADLLHAHKRSTKILAA